MQTTLENVVQPGAVVGGYRIEKKLGAGGFDRVYLAWRDGCPCALKFIHLESVGERAGGSCTSCSATRSPMWCGC